ncbi:MAG: AI-2E family transporter, partial [Betaproteobacteria bacterium]
MEKRIERTIQVVAGTALAIGCLMVLRPFLAALLSAAILCFSTWPLYRLIERRLGGRRTLAALAMTLLMILVLVLPLALIAGSYVDDVPQLLERLRETLAQGLPRPPGWVASIPLAGESLDSGWREIAGSKAALAEALKRIAQPARAVLVQAGIIVGEGVLQFTLIAFIGFFFYRDGAALALALRNGL